jgi:DNA mismatch endonuclease (patch repair protein)
MSDVFSTDKRSQIMAAVRGRGNRSTEGRFRRLLEEALLEGWREHPKDVYGSPDFVFDAERVAIFVDGCFWHGCGLCRNIPASNAEFWSRKIEATKARDELVNRELAESGWRVARFWEHELKKKNLEAALAKLQAALAR